MTLEEFRRITLDMADRVLTRPRLIPLEEDEKDVLYALRELIRSDDEVAGRGASLVRRRAPADPVDPEEP